MHRTVPCLLLLAAACSGPAAPRARPAPAPVPSGSPSLPVVATVTGDVDGDGRADRVELVESAADRGHDDWQLGVRVHRASGGTPTYWYLPGAFANEGQELAGVVDVHGDGRGEVVVSPGSTATDRGWDLFTLVGDDLTLVAGPDLRTGLLGSWGCTEHPGRLYAGQGTPAGDGTTISGTVTYYRFEENRLVETSSKRLGTWRLGAAAPAEFDPDPGCGVFG